MKARDYIEPRIDALADYGSASGRAPDEILAFVEGLEIALAVAIRGGFTGVRFSDEVEAWAAKRVVGARLTPADHALKLLVEEGGEE